MGNALRPPLAWLEIFFRLYCLKNGRFDPLILSKIVKTDASGCHILWQNAPNSISAGAPPQTSLGVLQRSPDSSGSKRSILMGTGGRDGRRGENGRKGDDL